MSEIQGSFQLLCDRTRLKPLRARRVNNLFRWKAHRTGANGPTLASACTCDTRRELVIGGCLVCMVDTLKVLVFETSLGHSLSVYPDVAEMLKSLDREREEES